MRTHVNYLSVSIVLIWAAGIFGASSARAQILTNLNDTSHASEVVSDGFWVAQPLVTGSDPSGYSLESLSLSLSNQLSPTDPLTVAIYSTSAGSVGSLITDGLLSGPAEPATGTDTWTPAASEPVFLAPSTQYWIVAATLEPNPQPAPAEDPFYGWSFVQGGSASSSTDNWTIPAGFDYSLDQGGTWQSGTAIALFSIGATDAVPEPQTWKLAGAILVLTGLTNLARRVWRRGV